MSCEEELDPFDDEINGDDPEDYNTLLYKRLEDDDGDREELHFDR